MITIKRPNGSGNIYKHSNKYIARVTIGFANGTQKYWKKSFDTYEEADRARLMMCSAPPPSKENIKLSELYKEWSVPYFKKISKSNADCYSAAYKWLKVLYNFKFKDLRTSHYQLCIDDCPNGRRSKIYIKNLVSQLYKYAMRNEIATRNLAEVLEVPSEETEEKHIFSDVHINKMWEAYNNGVDICKYPLFLIYFGWRISEATALTILNVKLDENYIIGGAKTKAGKNRPVPIPKRVKQMVSDIYKAGTIDSLFGLTSAVYRERFYQALDLCGIQKLSDAKVYKPHSCRHTYISMINHKGVDTKTKLELAGHSSEKMNLHYTHVNNEDKQKAVIDL